MPNRSSAARSRSPSRSARSNSPRADSACAFSSRIRSMCSFSWRQCACIPADSLAQVGELPLEALEPLLRDRVGLLLQRRPLDLELLDPPLDLVDLDRHAVDLDAQAAGGLVDQVDRLVGQEPAADVAVATARRQPPAPDPGSARRGGPRTAPSGRAGSRSCPRRSAPPPAPAGTAARARGPSRCACGTRRASWRRSRAARRGRASASACCRRPWLPRRRRRRRSCGARR